MKVRPARATVVMVGAEDYSAINLTFQSFDELIDALRANKATTIDLRVDPDAATDYERTGKVIFSLARNGLELVAINGVATKPQPLP